MVDSLRTLKVLREGCTEVHGGVCGGAQRCAEVYGGVHGGAQRCMEGCGGVHGGALRCTEGCVEGYAEVHREVQGGA